MTAFPLPVALEDPVETDIVVDEEEVLAVALAVAPDPVLGGTVELEL